MEQALRKNIEIKARCTDLGRVRGRMIALGAMEHESMDQVDTYFHCPSGRLKLRQIAGSKAQLIWYDRPDARAARISDFQLIEVADAPAVLAILGGALGIRGEVHKHREVLLWQNVRIHLDRVRGLGEFIELEAVISPEHDERVSGPRLEFLKEELQIAAEEMIGGSYSDLLGI